MFEDLLAEIRQKQHFGDQFIPLHAPVFHGKEKQYLLDTIDSTFVSSVGEYVNRMEKMLQEITGAKKAVLCVNGTSALEMCLRLAGTKPGDIVLTQSLSFVATANAIAHIGATPAFADIERSTLGLSPHAVQAFFESFCIKKGHETFLKESGQKISACVPMHSFGLSCRMNELQEICKEWNVPVVEDAAEALGSSYKGQHCGTMGLLGALSFNGNKTVTTGGGGAILTNDEKIGDLAKHLTTTAKLPHRWEYFHDYAGWNFRMPNVNAALGCAQLEQLPQILNIKRKRAEIYDHIFMNSPWEFVTELPDTLSNYWLCAVLTQNKTERDNFLAASNDAKLMTRPAWAPLHTLPMYTDTPKGSLDITVDIANRLVNLPSGVEGGIS